MQSMIGKTFWLVLLALLLVAAGGSAAGATPPQGYGQGQQNPPKPPQPAPITLDAPSRQRLPPTWRRMPLSRRLLS